MKFDNIIGNPPYKELAINGRQTNKSIWKDFLRLSMDNLKENGFLLMIHPMGWGSPSDNGKLIETFFASKNLMWADVRSELKTFFRGVGSTFSVTLTQNCEYFGVTYVKNDDGEDSLDLRKIRLITQSGQSIINKMILSPYPRVEFKLAGKKEQCSGNLYRIGDQLPTDIPLYTNIHHVNSSKDYLPNTTIPTIYSTKRSSTSDHRKIVIPYNGPPNVIVDDGVLGIGWCQFMILLDSETISGVRSVFNSRLFRYFMCKKYTQYNETKNLNLLPRIDMSREWTDQELFSLFNLSDTEIDLVDKSV